MTPTATIDRATLLPALQKLIRALKADLQLRLVEVPELDAKLRADAFEPIRAAGRTAQAYEAWQLDYLEQVAVAWVLACVFVRYMEDNGLIAETYLAGITPDRRRQADDAHATFLNAHPRDTDREYLLDVFRRVGSIPACRDLFAEGKTPLWALGPTGDGARTLLDFWRKIDPETGDLLRPFAVDDGDTRFLGDLYQDLSEEVRKKYALLQTPDFIERYLLDHTLTPAFDDFQLDEIRVIDPACGSGHLVLGAFWRLFRKWLQTDHVTDLRLIAQKALDASFGVDINPFAIAITRFRLILAAMHACGLTELKDAPGWNLNVAVGDSLIRGSRFDSNGNKLAIRSERLMFEPDSIYVLEEAKNAARILGKQYHVVVGNPPYTTAKDAEKNKQYRNYWSTCHQKFAQTVPFFEQFQNLTLRSIDGKPSGHNAGISSNSFAKREFGTKLVRAYLPTVDLTRVVDTSGVYLPGHGTPTVILVCRGRNPVSKTVRAILGKKGEPSVPLEPALGVVWKSIEENEDIVGFDNDYISVLELPRLTFCNHPWSLGGGGSLQLKESLDEESALKLNRIAESIGITSFTLEDDAFLLSERAAQRKRISGSAVRPMITGDLIREWCMTDDAIAIFPYDSNYSPVEEKKELPEFRHLGLYKSLISNNKMFGGKTKVQTGLKWFEYGRLTSSKLKVPFSISFAFVATHNHFVLDRGGKVFKQSAPVIKLSVRATEEEHLILVGLLNSSTACFWMKQTFHNKGSSVDSRGARQTTDLFENFYEFTGTGLGSYPIPEQYDSTLPLARELDHLARRCGDLSPTEMAKREVPTAERLEANRAETERLQGLMVAFQEELDWLCYRLYGLMESSQGMDGYDQPYPDPPGVRLGERPFEIAMARDMERGELETSWFERHGSTPITHIPEHWPGSYRTLVARRAAFFRENPNIALIERPEYKRRWNREPWDEQVRRALRSWLLDRLESAHYWPDPASEPPELTSCAALAERAAHDADFQQVAALYAGRPDFPLAKLVEELVAAESVPFLPVLRYKAAGLTKRLVWERTWDLQRREDAGEDVGAIPVPPKYASADFLAADVWRLRGKLDVPKERFVSYPHAHRDGDPSLVVAWAGWDHLRQAQALTAYYERMKGREAWPADRLVPLLAGLDQLVPWLIQWHNDLDPEYDLRMGDYYRDFLADEAQALGYTLDQVRAWTPPAKAKGKSGRAGKRRD